MTFVRQDCVSWQCARHGLQEGLTKTLNCPSCPHTIHLVHNLLGGWPAPPTSNDCMLCLTYRQRHPKMPSQRTPCPLTKNRRPKCDDVWNKHQTGPDWIDPRGVESGTALGDPASIESCGVVDNRSFLFIMNR
jgi:hypothetical protein